MLLVKYIRRVSSRQMMDTCHRTEKKFTHHYTYIPPLNKKPELPQVIRRMIGLRDIVGFGMNGQPMYTDHPYFPFPSIRWKETTPEIQALRERERGDWRLLSKEDKKKIYRSSFRSTYSEFLAPSTEWMGIIGVALMLMSAGLWLYILQKLFVYEEYPDSFTLESKEQQVKRILRMENNPILGIAHDYDYEKNVWKKKIPESRFSFPDGLDLTQEEYDDLMDYQSQKQGALKAPEPCEFNVQVEEDDDDLLDDQSQEEGASEETPQKCELPDVQPPTEEE
ncbi:uncharacterized protein LOC108734798 [Agrilus planipennis]|uniref:Cytochrome c oxidase subunit 4 n=1 Tax=Agrilus planipennis TaxID=224129 RepID=A0A1W4WDF7_AGRPL|nr:uncharacterized protein LOC108734798 [Agrilus planipennis]